MKKLMLFLCLVTTNAFAISTNTPMGNEPANPITSAVGNHQAGGGEQDRGQIFNQFKQLRVEGLQSRISIEQTMLSCVQNAQKREEMKQCDETAKSSMEALKKNQMQKFQAMKQSFQQAHQQHGFQGQGQGQGHGQMQGEPTQQ